MSLVRFFKWRDWSVEGGGAERTSSSEYRLHVGRTTGDLHRDQRNHASIGRGRPDRDFGGQRLTAGAGARLPR